MVGQSSDVYVKETDLSQVIGNASTSIAAIVFASSKGRVGRRYITSRQKFLDEYGPPNPLVSYAHYCALAFLDEGQQLYAARAVGAGALYGGNVLQKLAADQYDTLFNYPLSVPTAFDPTAAINGSAADVENLAYIYAIGPGAYAANVSVEIVSQNLKAVASLTGAEPYTAKFIATTNQVTGLTAPVDAVAVGVANVASLSGTTSVGGHAMVAGEYCLLTAQTTPSQNGYYQAAAGAWVKQPDPLYVRYTTGPVFYTLTAANTWSIYSATLNSTLVANADKALFIGQTTTSQNGIYQWASATGVWTKLADQSVVLITINNTLYNRLGGTYLQDTTFVGGSLSSGSYNYIVSAVNNVGENIGTAYTATVVTATNSFLTLSWAAVTSATSYRIYGRVTGGGFGFIGTSTSTSFVDYGNIVPVTATQPKVAYAGTPSFRINVYDNLTNATVPVEYFDCTLKAGLDGFGIQTEMSAVVNNESTGSNWIQVVNPSANYASVPLMYPTGKMALSGGTSGAAVSDSDIVNTWQLFADKEQINLNMLINGGYSSPTVQLAMDALASSRMDSIAILDLPSAYQTASAAVNWRNNTLNLSSNYSALFGPDVKIDDTFNGTQLYVPPSGHAAAVFAKTDRVAETWFAPAGLTRGRMRVLGVRQVYNRGDRELLQPAQVNYIRKFPGLGYALMESYTMQAQLSALSFIPVRRMLMVIETAVSKALLYGLWEPNDPVLRTMIVSMIGDYLEKIRRGRGITKYLVICDDSNNGPQSVNTGTLNVDVYVQPTLPAARISLQMVITKEGMSFSEAIAAAGQF